MEALRAGRDFHRRAQPRAGFGNFAPAAQPGCNRVLGERRMCAGQRDVRAFGETGARNNVADLFGAKRLRERGPRVEPGGVRRSAAAFRNSKLLPLFGRPQ